MKTYLITGGCGFIGSNFIYHITKKYGDKIRIINLDNLTYAGNLDNLKHMKANINYKFIKGDISDSSCVEYIFSENSIDYVVNFAAESHVDRSIKDPGVFVKTNILGTHNLLDAARRHWQTKEGFKKNKKYVQISTDEVYGSLGADGYFTESTPLNPHSPYSASKASADMLVKSYYDTYNMPVNITRCSNNYGPYQFPEKLIPLITCNCLEGRSIPVYGDGKNVRDWLYVEDHCNAIDLVLHNAESGEVYNIGGHNEKQNIEIVKMIIKVLQNILQGDKRGTGINDELIKFIEDRKGHDRRYAIDPAKITEELGWKPRTVFDEGIKKTVLWYLENEQWVNNILNGSYRLYYEDMYGDR